MSYHVQDLPLLYGAGQVVDTAVSVTDASTSVAAALDISAGKRYRFTIQNVGDAPCAIRVGATAAFGTNGELILAGGSAAADGLGGVLELPGCQAAVNAICDTSGTTTLAVYIVLV